MTREGMLEIISMMGNFSDDVLATSLAKECREFDGEDPVRFLRDLRDKCVRYSGGSAFIIKRSTPAFPKSRKNPKRKPRLVVLPSWRPNNGD